jgi:hypothetical protein
MSGERLGGLSDLYISLLRKKPEISPIVRIKTVWGDKIPPTLELW